MFEVKLSIFVVADDMKFDCPQSDFELINLPFLFLFASYFAIVDRFAACIIQWFLYFSIEIWVNLKNILSHTTWLRLSVAIHLGFSFILFSVISNDFVFSTENQMKQINFLLIYI